MRIGTTNENDFTVLVMQLLSKSTLFKFNLLIKVEEQVIYSQVHVDNYMDKMWFTDEFKTCSDLYMAGYCASGFYTIYPWDKEEPHYRPVEVYCDMKTNDEGWTVSIIFIDNKC